MNLKGRAYLMEPMYIRKVFLSSMAGALVLISMPASSQTIDLLAHRAVYEMTLESGGDAIGLVSVHGGLVIEVEDRCETWNVPAACSHADSARGRRAGDDVDL